MLVGIAGAFDALAIGPIADPLRGAIDHIVAKLSRIGVAVALVSIGYFGGRVVRVGRAQRAAGPRSTGSWRA